MSDNPHLGSSFDDFLREDGLYEEATAAAVKHVLAWQIQQATAVGRRLTGGLEEMAES